jgi:hypothetical protein
VRKDGNTTRAQNPLHNFRKLGPVGLHIARLTLAQKPFECLCCVLDHTFLYKRTGEVWPPGHIPVCFCGGLVQQIINTGFTQFVCYGPGPGPAICVLPRKSILEILVARIEIQTHDMNRVTAPDTGQLSSGNQGNTLLRGRAGGGCQACHSIVVGQSQVGDALGCGAIHKVLWRQSTV